MTFSFFAPRRLFAALFFSSIVGLMPAADADRLVYKTVDDRELTLQVVRPADWRDTDRRAALVFFHGGGWTGGEPRRFAKQAEYFASRGLVCLLVEYRLLGKDTLDPPLICVQDAKSALRWVRSHAEELGIDPGRLGAVGGSAGGHLAAFAGMVAGLDDPQDDRSISPRPDALVLFNPVLDNGSEDGWGRERVGERFQEFSPAHNVTGDDPPTLVLVGTKDKLIPVAVIERFKAAMLEAGVRCEVRYYEGQGHGFFRPGRGENDRYFRETLQEADDFLASLGWLPAIPAPAGP